MRAVLRSLPTLIRPLRQPCLPLRFRRLVSTLGPFQLRGYQEDCIQAILRHIDEGGRRMGVSLATGSGKTVIFTQLIQRLIHPTSSRATQTLILVHRKELVEQAAIHCTKIYPELSVEIEMASSHASGTADITIASIMSIISGDRIEKFDPTRFKLILIDECHHAVSSGYLRCLEYFGLKEPSKTGPILVGVSATMSRFDGLKLGKIMDHIVYHRDYLDMIADNWLSSCKFTTVKTSVDLSGVGKSQTGDFHTGDLGRAVNTDELNGVTVRSWLEKAKDRKSTLVFCVDIAHVSDMTEKFRDFGIDARPITSNTLLQDRRERLAAFKNGEFQVLVNCGVFTEGTDIPNIDCVLLARPTKSRNLLIQMIGRGMRLSPGKEDCHVIDMVGALEKGIVTVPTLFGLDPDELIEKSTAEDLQKRANELKAQREAEAMKSNESESFDQDIEGRDLNVTFTDYESVFDLLADQKEVEYIRRLSMFSWVAVGDDNYVLSLKGSNFLRIEKIKDGTFTVTETYKIPPQATGGKYMTIKREVITGGASLSDVIQGADTLAANRQIRLFLLHKAPWREKPATEEQKKFLELFNYKVEEDDELTKGEAGDMITKLKHGAHKRFEQLMKGKKKGERLKERRMKEEERLKAKEEKLRAEVEKLRKREEVTVGSLVI